MREKIIALAKKNGADIVGFAPAGRFSENDPIFKILPQTKTVIGPGSPGHLPGRGGRHYLLPVHHHGC